MFREKCTFSLSSFFSFFVEVLCSSKVCELHVHVLGEKDVFGLEVSVDDALHVEMLQRVDNLCCVKARTLLVKRLVLSDVRKQLSARAQLNDIVYYMFGNNAFVCSFFTSVFLRL